MKRLLVCLTLAGLLGLGGQAFAVIGTVDDVPAATLLLPKFVVETDANGVPVQDGLTTLFSINNASAAPALVHVTLWTNASIPTLDFSVFLTGYDVVTVNMRDVFNGIVPQTEHVTDADTISPVGLFSTEVNPITGVGGGAPNSCDEAFPLGPVPGILVDFIRSVHRGGASPLPQDPANTCYAFPTEFAEGYVTIDNVTQCTIQTPADCEDGYFPNVGANVNQLWGDYFYVDTANNFAQGETLVHVEADPSLTEADYTFYRRFCGTGQDDREGLTSTFAVRYLTGGAFDGGTTLKVWRDSKNVQSPTACPFDGDGFPLGQNQIVIFDEDENPFVAPESPFSPPIEQEAVTPFPWEVNNTLVGGPNLPSPFNFGWLYLNLNFTQTELTPPSEAFFTGEPAAQSWVTATMDALGLFSVGFDAIQLDNVTFAGPTAVTAPGRSNICIGEDGAADPCS